MGIFSKIFKKNNKGGNVSTTAKTSFAETNDIPDVAVLSYGNGTYKIPVDGFREGMKRYGYVKGYSPEKGFIDLKDLGDELLIFDPKYGHTIPLQDCDNPDYEDIKRAIYK